MAQRTYGRADAEAVLAQLREMTAALKADNARAQATLEQLEELHGEMSAAMAEIRGVLREASR